MECTKLLKFTEDTILHSALVRSDLDLALRVHAIDGIHGECAALRTTTRDYRKIYLAAPKIYVVHCSN